MRRGICLLMLLALLFFRAKAQGDSTTAGAPHYLDIAYNNDTFTFTDMYYTHGFRISYANPRFSRIGTSRILLKLRSSVVNTYGVTLVQDVFTPSSITRDRMMQGDRPYAAYAYAGHFVHSVDPKKKIRLLSELHAGVIGPFAMGYEVQSGYHRLIDDKHPKGWEGQVKNDLVFNYSLSMEKGILTVGNMADISINSGIAAGTLYDNISAGAMTRLGRLSSRFGQFSSRKWEAYLFIKGDTKLVAYNATLQGGMLNRDNAYVLDGGDINMHIYSGAAGLVIAWRGFEVEHSYKYMSAELRTGMAHRWGQCRIRVRM